MTCSPGLGFLRGRPRGRLPELGALNECMSAVLAVGLLRRLLTLGTTERCATGAAGADQGSVALVPLEAAEVVVAG